MKSTAVDESLSSMNQQFCSRENQLLQMLQQNEKSTQIKFDNECNYLHELDDQDNEKIKQNIKDEAVDSLACMHMCIVSEMSNVHVHMI